MQEEEDMAVSFSSNCDHEREGERGREDRSLGIGKS